METPKYRVTAPSWIGNTIRQEGAIVEYVGRPGSNLEPMNAAAAAMVQRHGRALPAVEVPQMAQPSAPPAAPVDWREAARAAGWMPPEAAGADLAGQAPQAKPAAEKAVEGVAGNHPAKAAEGKPAGGAASKLNPAKPAGNAGSSSADI